MYDPHQILDAVDTHVTLFMTLGNITMVFNYVFFISAILAGKRDRVFPFPLAACTLWFAHDVSYLLNYDQWFNVYNHWYLKLFWGALIPTSTIEGIYIYQVWLYGKDELMPGASRQAWLLYVLTAVVAGGIAWASLKYFLDDPIYAYAFGATGFLSVAFNIPRLLARRDAAGQSVTMWVSYVGMQACWFTTTILLFGPAFRSPAYLAIGACCIVGGLFMVVSCHRLKRTATSARDGALQGI